MKASQIIDKVSLLLQDKANTRWARAELIGWLNDGQRETVIARPDAHSENAEVTLIDGPRQSIPAGAIQLLDVVRNTNGKAIRLVNRDLLDAQAPDWYSHTKSNVIKNYTFDGRNPQTFYVYPPATAGAKVDVVISTCPAEIMQDTQDLGLPDIYANALTDYVLYRAFSKDSDYAANATRAASHYNSFAQAIGAKTKVDLTVNPNAA